MNACWRIACCLTLILILAQLVGGQERGDQEPKKIALLIGVESYQKSGFRELNYSEDDMSALKTALESQDFSVTLMLGSGSGVNQATKANIDKQIKSTFIPTLKTLNKTDIVLVALAGHGRHQKVVAGNEDHFFCPSDAHNTDSSTWISISSLIRNIEKESGSECNLILVDACRDISGPRGGVDGSGITLDRETVAVLFAASYGEQAYEPDEFKHGLFTYFVLEGLNGAAVNFDKQVTWNSLADYVMGRVDRKSRELKEANKISGIQRPNSIGNLRGESPVLVELVSAPVIKPPGNSSSSTESVAKTISSEKSGIAFTLIPAGKFTMGSPAGEAERYENETQHEVVLTQPFYLGVTEVTQDQWKQVMNTTPWDGQENVKVGGTNAAAWITWEDAITYCNKLSQLEGRPAYYSDDRATINGGTGYRLPTEAEWEYACRAGRTEAYSFGADAERLGDFAWHDKNAWDIGEKYAHAVGRKKPNGFGLFDMHGNVWEWCWDLYGEYGDGSLDDPVGAVSGSDRVNRGGSWSSEPRDCRSAIRFGFDPSNRSSNLGFRVASSPFGPVK